MRARWVSGGSIRSVFVMAMLALAPSGRAEGGRIVGTVVDVEGRPAAGAEVWAAKLAFPGVLERVDARADGSGAYSLEVGPGTWAVHALRGDEGGRSDWNALAEVKEGRDPGPVAIRLRAPTRLRGRLLDAETGLPIGKGHFALDDARRPEVDAQGRFEVGGLEPTHHEAYPVCPGHERRRVLFDTTGRPDAELELRLPRAGRFVGSVLDSGGRPIPGAIVGQRTSGSIFSGSALWERCSDDGRFTYDGRPLGRAGRFSARATGYQAEELGEVVVLEASTPTEVRFLLRPDPMAKDRALKNLAAKWPGHRVVSGSVVGPGGKPVASALVRWGLLVDSNAIPETRTDAEGAFRIEGVPDSEDVLSVMSKGLAAAFPRVESGGDRQVRVELLGGATIRGRVVDDAGGPIEGVRVVPTVPNPSRARFGTVYLDEMAARSDRDGRFAIAGMADGVTCDAISPGWSAVRQWPLSPSDESKNVITLSAGGAIRGRVLDLAGNPVRNFRIQLAIPKERKPGEAVGGYFAGYGGTGLSFTRADGEFTISGLTAGTVQDLKVIAGPFGSAEVARVKAPPINRLGPAADLTIRLGMTHPLRVRVFTIGGKVVEGARVTVIQDDRRAGFEWGGGESSWDDRVTLPIRAEGWADFSDLPFPGGTIIVRARGYSRAKLDRPDGPEPVEILLQPEARIEGTVLDAAGKPAPGARFSLSWGRGETAQGVADQDGRIRVEGLAPGPYRLAITTGTGPTNITETLNLEPGKAIRKDFRPRRDGAPAAPGP